MAQRDPQHLHALVDMGSNGIRFSITNLQPPFARIMPTLYQQRVGISLYDAQYAVGSNDRRPIGEDTIASVLSALRSFQRTCRDFCVPASQITVLATEATRTAINSEDFIKRIRAHVGWDVILLAKEEEGRVGAAGVASSLPAVRGLVMDLGGGSTQLTWLVKELGSGEIRGPKSGAVSMPYGAAALSRRLREAESSKTTPALRKEILATVQDAYASLNLPEELKIAAREQDGFTLYLSGGGFRGWGYVLMSQGGDEPYPIATINGFHASRRQFLGIDAVKAAAAASLNEEDDQADIFRVSDRRASQVPAVAFLIDVLAEALPQIKDVRFCQGGVREGYLFRAMDDRTRAQHPLLVATQTGDRARTAAPLVALLQSSLPESSGDGAAGDPKSVFTPDLLEAFANLIFHHASHPKELRAPAALRCTTAGLLAGVHGIPHEARTFVALLLCARWGGSDQIPPADEAFKQALERLVASPWTCWWINYLGAVTALVAEIYAAGVVEPDERPPRIRLQAKWERDEKKAGSGRAVALHISPASEVDRHASLIEAKGIEKVGKRKRWIGGRDGVGYRVAVHVAAAGPA